MSRKLPIYLLLDCSESMLGEPIAAVQKGVQDMTAHLRSDPYSLETAWLGVITFSHAARVLVPLTELPRFSMPPLRMGTGTALGAALTSLEQCMATDVVKSSPERKGDYKPLVFVLTDGDPTDDWEAKADRFRHEYSARRATVVAVVCGSDASPARMRRLTDTVIMARDLDSSTFKSLFKWVSASIATASQSVDGRRELRLEGGSGLAEATEADYGRSADRDRRVFVHCRCVKDGQFYIATFRRQGEDPLAPYHGVDARLDPEFDHAPDGGHRASEPQEVSSDRLLNAPACPACRNEIWAFCTCGHVHCSPREYEGMTMTCPWCKSESEYSQLSSALRVGRGAG